MAITQALCNSFKKQLLEGVHDFRSSGGDTFNMALYTSSSTLNATTAEYTATNEVASGSGYTTGGKALTNAGATLSGTTAFIDFNDVSWPSSTFTCRGALIYNTTPAHTYTNPSVCVLDFGTDKTTNNGTLSVQFPTPDATNAIVRLA